jgi:alpha-N-arabinofuranosidase
VQHAHFDAALTVIPPTETGVEAGLTVFQNEKQYFQYQVRRTQGGVSLAVVRCHQGKVETLAQRTIDSAGPVTLHLAADGPRYAFGYSLAGDSPEPLLLDVDSYPVTVQAAGGGLHFTGLTIGPHAHRH